MSINNFDYCEIKKNFGSANSKYMGYSLKEINSSKSGSYESHTYLVSVIFYRRSFLSRSKFYSYSGWEYYYRLNVSAYLSMKDVIFKDDEGNEVYPLHHADYKAVSNLDSMMSSAFTEAYNLSLPMIPEYFLKREAQMNDSSLIIPTGTSFRKNNVSYGSAHLSIIPYDGGLSYEGDFDVIARFEGYLHPYDSGSDYPPKLLFYFTDESVLACSNDVDFAKSFNKILSILG